MNLIVLLKSLLYYFLKCLDNNLNLLSLRVVELTITLISRNMEYFLIFVRIKQFLFS